MTDQAAEPVIPVTPPTEPVVPEPVPEPVPAPVRRRWAAPILALALVALAALVAASPFWAPALVPLLPWGPPAPADANAALADRLDRVAAAQTSLSQAAVAAATANAAALSALDKRLAALESRPPPAPPDLSGIQQQLAALTATVGTLGTRLGALEKTVQAQPAGDPIDAALALVTLQIGDAVRVGRPFADEYDTFVGFARARPDLVAAAAPLAGPAKTGVASRTVLTQQLHALAAQIATAEPPPAAGDWRGEIIARLRSLVTIRRIDGAGASPAEAAVAKAETAMAAGDLAAAIAALQPLTGASAEAARPWLQTAAARLQAEDALHKVTTLLAAHLGSHAAAPAPPG